MLFRRETLAGIAAGEIDLAFRRWPRARVKAGTRLRTAIGVLEVVAVEVVDARASARATRGAPALPPATSSSPRSTRSARATCTGSSCAARVRIRASPCARTTSFRPTERAELGRRPGPRWPTRARCWP